MMAVLCAQFASSLTTVSLSVYKPSTILGTWHAAGTKTGNDPCLPGALNNLVNKTCGILNGGKGREGVGVKERVGLNTEGREAF